ncbi:hypothetical protein ACH3VR_19655 [Microbacterium sp. B2969]|uniref:ABC transporter permease n=1 Tax=Microbacterium alkaliflavum TaxID=3248839 RepID=A0ABW7QEI2_9MICO
MIHTKSPAIRRAVRDRAIQFRAATFIAMQKLWPFVMLAGGTLVVIAFFVWFDDADCGSDRDCGYLVGLAAWF